MDRALMLAAGVALAGCHHAPAPPGAMALYDPSPSRDDFYSLPWPSDARLVPGGDGKPRFDLTGFYRAGGGQVGIYLDAILAEPSPGFGTQSAIFFRFDAPIDRASLPQGPADSTADAASAFVIDVTPGSPGYGKKAPVRIDVRAGGPEDDRYSQYIGRNALALLPEPGFPLREKTTYAAVVTSAVRALDGGAVRADPRYPRSALSAEALTVLGAAADHVVVSTTFTTLDATSGMQALRDAAYGYGPPPTAQNFQYVDTKLRFFDHYEGSYRAPNFQEGAPPYLHEGGRIHLGADGTPQATRPENLRFALSVPLAPMPPAGWPVVIYAHGTGGNYETFLDDGSAADACYVADAGHNAIDRLAMISIDMVNHGPRDPTGTNPDITFINLFNIAAARDNPKQGAADDFTLLRLVETFQVASAPKTGVPIRFDPSKIYFKGHSEGGITGALFLAFEPKVKAAVLSGAGGDFLLSLLGKHEPTDIPKLVADLIGEPIDEFHPLLNLIQNYLESVDPANYGHLLFRDPAPGIPPRSVFHSLGVVDNYTPVPTIMALALAMGAQPAGKIIDPIADLPLVAGRWGTAPLQSNVAGGHATGVMVEYQVPLDKTGMQRYDGHFVVMEHPDARRQSNGFLATHARDGVAQLIP